MQTHSGAISLLAQVQASRVSPGRWAARIPRDWWAWAGPHGGLLAAVGLNATLDVVSEQASALVPRAVSVRFHGRCGDGPLDVRAKAERVSASSTIVATEVRQDGEVVVSSVTTLTAPRPGLSLQNTQGPVAAPPEDCEVFQLPADLVPFGRQVEIRPAGGALPLTGSDLAEMRAWLRLRTALPVDPTVAVVLADALAPGIFPRLIAPAAVPTVELTVHFHGNLRSAPVDDWVLAVQRNVSCDDGWCVDETELWSRGGKLLAQARQLRRLLGAPALAA
ncbi:acyl-CoA thioesterase II [Streptomyces sp. NWU339]|uniref:acyl-CoA thioesterase n=1 Tax=Streptomyces sp. NWU339 TaxID=2185284 RepID=UPI0011B7D31E|nr:thioesterase family protein [Streptomyces sp. NWU339]